MTGVGGSTIVSKGLGSSLVDNRDVLVEFVSPSLPWGMGEKISLPGLKVMAISGWLLKAGLELNRLNTIFVLLFSRIRWAWNSFI